MDDLSDRYDAAVLALIDEWRAEDDPSFAVVWQPGQAIDLAHYPITAVSDVDCFHPSGGGAPPSRPACGTASPWAWWVQLTIA
jgi:hypothetical protein